MNSIKSEVSRISRVTRDNRLEKVKTIEELEIEIKGFTDIKVVNRSIDFSADLNRVPDAIKEEIQVDLKEMKACYSHKLYRSAVILCGRVLEVALHRKYFECTGKDLLKSSPGIGLGKLIAKLKENDVSFPPGISQQVHLINHIRINTVHKKHKVFYPSKHQSHATILYTLDIIEQLF